LTPRARLVVLGRPRAAFHVLGVTGLAASLAVCAAVLVAHEEPLWALPVIGGTGVASFVVLALAVKALTGRESLVYYHHEILVLAACAAVTSAAGLDVAASLDAAALGVGAFLAFGRIGCLNAGCCHGRPARRGVCYGPAHLAEGFASELVGVRLVPVQAVEAAGAATITLAGLACVAAGAAPGVALGVYVAAYGLLRFGLEEWRGDAGRRRLFGFSEAQWTSLVLTAAAAVAYPVAAVAPAAIAVAMTVLAWRGRSASSVAPVALARALERSGADGAPVPVGGGLLLSSGTAGGARHYTLSGARPRQLREAARTLLALRHADAVARVLPGGGGVLHLVVPADDREPAQVA
jgi:hypothetical protein